MEYSFDTELALLSMPTSECMGLVRVHDTNSSWNMRIGP